MANPYELALGCIRFATYSKKLGNADRYKGWMREALSYINRIPNPEHRKKYVSMWFAAFNKTNNELRKSS